MIDSSAPEAWALLLRGTDAAVLAGIQAWLGITA